MLKEVISFRDWLKLQETGTSTADVAVFARPCIGMVRRIYPGFWGQEDPFFKKKKKKTVETD